MTALCLNPCGSYYDLQGDYCGLDEGHAGPCMPRTPELRHGRDCRHYGEPVGSPPLSAELCICDPYGDKERALRLLLERRRRREFLWQDEVWYQADGSPIRVKDMDLWHMRNVVALLERRAPGIKFAFEMSLAGAPVNGEHATDAIDQILAETMEQDDREWLHETPLVRRLDRRIRKQARKELSRDFA